VTDGAITFTVYGEPKSQGSKVAGRTNSGRLYVRESNPDLKEWRRQVAQAAGAAAAGRFLSGPIRLTLLFVRVRPDGHFGTGRNVGKVKPSSPPFPETAPDLTKLERAVEDALTGVVFQNDARIVQKSSQKVYGEPARCEVRVEPVPFPRARDKALPSAWPASRARSERPPATSSPTSRSGA
jgi:Holliday junction resolvase RusA-like endonuclease